MSAFGYGSSYSFKSGDFNPGFTQGMGQDPRQIVSKSGMDTGASSMKGATPMGAGGMPTLNTGSVSADPFGLNFNPTEESRRTYSDSINNLAYNLGDFGDFSGMASGQMANQYQQAFNSIAQEQKFNPISGATQSGTSAYYDNLRKGLQDRYQQWLNQMLQGGSFGLTGGGVSYGQRQGGF